MEVDLRDQALALISDAQTADKKDKDVYLRQVQELCLHRAPALLDEMVALLISEFQADPQASTRKLVVEFLEEVVRGHPSFCQPSMVDTYSHMLQHDSSAVVLKRVLVGCANLHSTVFKYTVTQARPPLWHDYMARVKTPIMHMVQYLDSGGVEGGGGMSTLSLVRGDGGVSLAVIRYMEALAFVASTPSRSSSIASRPTDTFTIADVPPEAQASFHVSSLREEGEEVVRWLLSWLMEGRPGFGPPQYTTLINTASALASHRSQWLPVIASSLSQALNHTTAAARSANKTSVRAHLCLPGVGAALKATCLKFIRLSSARAFPPSLEQLADALRHAGLEEQLSPLPIPSHLKTRPLPPLPDPTPSQPNTPTNATATSTGAHKRSYSPPPLSGPPSGDVSVRSGRGKRRKSHDPLAAPMPQQTLQLPEDWLSLDPEPRVTFVLNALTQAPLPPAPYRDPRVRVAEAVSLVETLIKDLVPDQQPDTDLAFLRCVVKEVPMQVSRAVESEQGTQALAATQVSTLQAEVPLEEVRRRDKESYRTQASHALQRLLHAHQEAEEFGVNELRVKLVGRLSCVVAQGGVGGARDEEGIKSLHPLLSHVTDHVTYAHREVLESVLYELFLSALLPAGEGDEPAADGEGQGEKEGEKAEEGEERWAAYDELLGRLLTRLLAKTDAKDKGVTALLLCAPRVPLSAVDSLQEALLDKSGARLMQGLMSLTDLAIYRPGPLREECVKRVLALTEHENAEVRRRAIQNAVLKRLYVVSELRPSIEEHATQQLQHLTNATQGGEEDEEGVKRKLYLYLALCSKNDLLVPGLFEAYANARSEAIKGVMQAEAELIVQHVLRAHGAGSTLQSLAGCSPGASPLILQCLNLLVPETQARPRPPPADVVTAAKALRTARGGDVAYVLPVLGGLTKEELVEALPGLMEKDLVDEKCVKRIVVPYGSLPAADALVVLHQVDPEAAKVPLKKYLDVLQQCLNMKTLFPHTALTLALVKMVDDPAVAVPYAYMRTAILAIKTYPQLKPTIADTVVPKLVTRQIWVSQPRVWEGVVLLPKYLGARDTSDKTAQALLDLPLPQLQEVLKKSPEVKGVLATYASRSKKTASLDPHKRKAIGL